jgi:hypothetical protein
MLGVKKIETPHYCGTAIISSWCSILSYQWLAPVLIQAGDGPQGIGLQSSGPSRLAL